jgi:6-phosphogluconolactonase (cycloisomerase 2 family)
MLLGYAGAIARRCLVLLASLLLVPLALAGSAAAASRLYMPDYSTDVVAGFDRAANGSLTPLPGSPFATAQPGAPIGGLIGFGFTPDGGGAAASYLVGGGAQGLSIGPSGALAPAGPATSTADVTGLAISPDGRFAYAPTREYPPGTPAQGIRVFSIGTDGALTLLSFATAAEGFGDVAMTPDGRFLFAALYGGGSIKRFAVNPNGSLTPLGTTALSGARYLTTSPDGRFLFVGSDGGVAGGVYSLSIGSDGSLTQNGDPALTGAFSVDLFAVAPDGAHLYFPDSNVDQVFTAAIAADGKLSVVGAFPDTDPEATAVSPDGRFLYTYHRGAKIGIDTASIGANGLPTPLPLFTPWQSGEAVRLNFQPGPAPVANFTAQAAAPGAAVKFDANASTNAAVYNWDFGDGATLANGGPKPSHVYAKAGKYAVKLSLTDASGCGAAQIYTGQSTTCPGGTATTKTLTLDTLPVLDKLKVAPKKFLPKGTVPNAKGKRGTSFRYKLNENASVSLKIERKLPGRKVGGKCKKMTKANAGRKPCPLFKRLGSRPSKGKTGANKLEFNGKIKGKSLVPGAYRVTAIATDPADGRSAPRYASFQILPG